MRKRLTYNYRARKLYKLARKIARIPTTSTTRPSIDDAIILLCKASREYKYMAELEW